MTETLSDQPLIHQLLTLKTQYEQALTAIDTKVTYYKDQIAHINALLLDQFIPVEQPQPLTIAQIDPVTPLLALQGQVEPSNDRPLAVDLTLDAADFLKSAPKPRKSRTASRPKTPTPARATLHPKGGKRSSLSLLPAYQGMTKLEAIKTVLATNPGQAFALDTLTQALYGELSAAEHQAERLRMKSALFQGLQKNLWQKAEAPSSYLIAAESPRRRGGRRRNQLVPAEETAQPVKTTPEKARRGRSTTNQTPSKQRNSLPFVSAYAGQKKLAAIAQVLQQHSGEVLHHDTIIQTLYGDLSPQDLKAERIRIKTALLTGVKKGWWYKAKEPSRYYFGNSEAVDPSPSATKGKKTGRRGKAKVAE